MQLSQLPSIYIEIHQPGDKGDFVIRTLDGKLRQKITENRLNEDRSYLEFMYTARLLEGGGMGFAAPNTDIMERQRQERLDDLARYGQQLYRELFGKDSTFKNYLRKQPHLKDGARLVLRLHSTATELWNIPWEYMHDGEKFLGIHPAYPVIRSLLDTPLERDNLNLSQLPCPLRMLVIFAHPKDAPPLNIDAEAALIQRAIKAGEEQGLIEIDFVEEGTLQNLETAIAERDYHLLHYSGHGAVTSLGSALIMEDENGFSQPVFLHQLLPIIQRAENLRFIFLSACKAGRITEIEATSSIATGLLQVVPAVLAMQFSVRDDRANVLAEAVYGRLACGSTLEEALHTARTTLHQTDAQMNDWGVPALYLHKPNIRLLDTQSAPPAAQKRSVLDLSKLPLTTSFVGRHGEQRQMRSALLNPDIRMVYIWGMAGIGKSTLVRHVLERPGKRDLITNGLVLRCSELTPPELYQTLMQWIGQNFPEAIAYLTDKQRLSPEAWVKAVAKRVRGKRFVLVIDQLDIWMRPQENRHGELAQAGLVAFFRALATAEWSILTIFTSRWRWSQLIDLWEDYLLEIHLGMLEGRDGAFLMHWLPQLKTADPKIITSVSRLIGGHPLTLHDVNNYLGKQPQSDTFDDEAFAKRLAGRWHKLFLGQVIPLLKPGEREALRVLSIHQGYFHPQYVQQLAQLRTLKEAEDIMMGWEALSLAYHIGTDENETPWYLIPNLVDTYITSQLTPETKRLCHERVARVIEQDFVLDANTYNEKNNLPRRQFANDFEQALDYINLALRQPDGQITQRYLNIGYTWYQHCHEAGKESQATAIALTLIPWMRTFQAHESEKELIEAILTRTSPGTQENLRAQYWQATNLMDEGHQPEALTAFQKLEKLCQQKKAQTLLIDTIERLGEVYRNLGKDEEAKAKWRTALEQRKTLKDWAGAGRVLYYLGEQAYFKKDTKALRHLEDGLKYLSQTEPQQVNRRLVANLLLYRGHLYRRDKDDVSALQRYDAVIKMGQELSDPYLIAKGLESAGYCYGLLRQYDIAAACLLKAVDIYENINDLANMAIALTRLAMVYDYKDNISEALALCERALRLARQTIPAAIPQTEAMLLRLRRKKRK
ncbi:MAG TPA: CHAT domain-containing protein [Phototrophicaceae bacterium]|nr:CHAT domain-containing protein [Phototrophicaceae bacterium]